MMKTIIYTPSVR